MERISKGILDSDVFKTINSISDAASRRVIPNNVNNINHLSANSFINNINNEKVKAFADKVNFSIARNRGENSKDIVKTIRRGDANIDPTINNIIKTKLPFKNYSNMRKRSDDLAIKIGFDNEEEFGSFISKINPNKITVKEMTRLQKFLNYVKKHPKSFLKVTLTTGGISALVIYLQKYQRKHTGCFRYHNSDDDKSVLVRQKFKGNFCIGNDANKYDDDDEEDDDDIIYLEESLHPLYHISTWKNSCNYTEIYSGTERDKENVSKILSLGCQGLCDWVNYNILSQYSNGKHDAFNIKSDVDESKYDKYLFKCEKITILRSLSTSAGDVLDDAISGFMESNFGQRSIKFIISSIFKLIIFICLIFISVYLLKSISLKNPETLKNEL